MRRTAAPGAGRSAQLPLARLVPGCARTSHLVGAARTHGVAQPCCAAADLPRGQKRRGVLLLERGESVRVLGGQGADDCQRGEERQQASCAALRALLRTHSCSQPQDPETESQDTPGKRRQQRAAHAGPPQEANQKQASGTRACRTIPTGSAQQMSTTVQATTQTICS